MVRQDFPLMAIFGPPGAGKGTLCQLAADRYGAIHLSTGQMFRNAISSGNELGLRVKNLLANGILVDDQTTNEIVAETLAHPRLANAPLVILDGYPRTIGQKIFLDEIAELDKIVLVTAQPDELVRRISGRSTCSSCAAIYHDQLRPSQFAHKCDNCQGTLVKRSDDNPETARERINDYNELTAPVLAAYQTQQAIVKIEPLDLKAAERQFLALVKEMVKG
ncbi:unnamed protein product [Didymodactylos carnosus]|uniref:Adenylate kinase active site lid domain-containing protein n=1 Tax=Didymodactylos carnosus TaxID=1234261 RepID=A0A8S2GRM4_9BILA|nr:unnamed protein product [Didymodactylos carnosus]CAF3532542.1 unnamed protein product [Didymodactylos carnosus]